MKLGRKGDHEYRQRCLQSQHRETNKNFIKIRTVL